MPFSSIIDSLRGTAPMGVGGLGSTSGLLGQLPRLQGLQPQQAEPTEINEDEEEMLRRLLANLGGGMSGGGGSFSRLFDLMNLGEMQEGTQTDKQIKQPGFMGSQGRGTSFAGLTRSPRLGNINTGTFLRG